MLPRGLVVLRESNNFHYPSTFSSCSWKENKAVTQQSLNIHQEMTSGSNYLSLVLNQSWSNNGYDRLEHEDSIRLVKLKRSYNYDDPIECSLFNTRLSEKPHQVRMMGKIFSHAREVIAWLGVARDGSDSAIDYFRAHAFIEQRYWDAKATRIEIPRPSEYEANAISSLLNRSYWRRVWIVQEIQPARHMTFRCGSRSITVENFLAALCYPALWYLTVPSPIREDTREWFDNMNGVRHLTRPLSPIMTDTKIEELDTTGITGSECLFKSRSLRQRILASVPFQHLEARKRGRRPLGHLVHICVDGDFESTEPREYIYALIAIADDPWISFIQVDYEKPLELIYREALPFIREAIS